VSKIEWTDATWNPTVGCTKVSPGCNNCYANVMHGRLARMGQQKYELPFTDVRAWPPALRGPLQWTSPRRIFVNSMSDIFHRRLDASYIRAVWDVMVRAPQHTFQVLTKRSARLAALGPELPWPSHVWMGVSVESADYMARIDHLRQVPAAVRFLSLEPLLGPLPDLALTGIHWVIVGGESGHHARPFALEWAHDVIAQCQRAGVPVFFKQAGRWPIVENVNLYDFPPHVKTTEAFGETIAGARVRLTDRKGADLAELPELFRVRQYPEEGGTK